MKLVVKPVLELTCPWCGEQLTLRGGEPLVHDGQRLELEVAIGAVDVERWTAYKAAIAEALSKSQAQLVAETMPREEIVVPEKPQSVLLGGFGETMRLREKLAEYAHSAWSGWMKYLFEKTIAGSMLPGVGEGSVVIPRWAVERWTRQMNTEYTDLPESEKMSDRSEADKMLAIFKESFFT